MTFRRSSIVAGSCLSIVIPIVAFVTLPSSSSEKIAAAENSNAHQVTHGKYLVHHVAQCIQCHTPRDESGRLVESQLLAGAIIPVDGPPFAQQVWAAESASIKGLGNYDETYVRYLLTHGHKPDGSSPKAPMPHFKFNDADADAVIAYLRSL